MIVAGALVTSTGSGLAVPDWPLSFGQFFPKMTGGVFYEHGHRMVAGTVAILTTILFFWICATEKRKWLRWVAAGSWLMILVQALLGGITVLYGLPGKVSMAHAVLAQTLFCLNLSIAIFTSPEWEKKHDDTETSAGGKAPASFRSNLTALFFISSATTVLVFLQLVIGAAFRHGSRIEFLKLHIYGAVLVSEVIFAVYLIARKQFRDHKEIYYPALSLMFLVAAQIFLGVIAALPIFSQSGLAFNFNTVAIATAHVALGALILGVSFVITLNSFRLLMEGRGNHTEKNLEHAEFDSAQAVYSSLQS